MKENELRILGTVTLVNNAHNYTVTATGMKDDTGTITQIEKPFTVHCYPGPKVKMNHIRILLGDTVEVVASPYDLTQGRIVYRLK